jgi:hypothetical protein
MDAATFYARSQATKGNPDQTAPKDLNVKAICDLLDRFLIDQRDSFPEIQDLCDEVKRIATAMSAQSELTTGHCSKFWDAVTQLCERAEAAIQIDPTETMAQAAQNLRNAWNICKSGSDSIDDGETPWNDVIDGLDDIADRVGRLTASTFEGTQRRSAKPTLVDDLLKELRQLQKRILIGTASQEVRKAIVVLKSWQNSQAFEAEDFDARNSKLEEKSGITGPGIYPRKRGT